jgi:DNA-binding response OmpR family regulator
MKVVLIDDTPEIAELLTFALRDCGYDVFASNFTGDIITLLDEQHADALVINCTALEMSEAVFDSVRADDARATLPVVMVSDTPEKADASLRKRRAEHVLLIPKPFSGSQIARALDQLLTPDA